MGTVVESWAVHFHRSVNLGHSWKFECFAYHDKITDPPYPGHSVLKAWLDANCTSARYEVKFYPPPQSFGSYLEVVFDDPEEAMMFRIKFS